MAALMTVVVLTLACHGSIARYVPLAASDNIEARICRNEQSGNEDVLIRDLQIYVQ